MLMVWRLVHTFGFIAWFVGLLGTTAAQVGVRKASDPQSRRSAWAVLKRLTPYEMVGMVLTPIGGVFLTIATYGHLFRGSPSFVHIKLLLVLIALVGNILLVVMRKKAEALLDDPTALTPTLKRMSMVQGITTLMLPVAVLVVIVIKYKGMGG